MIGCREITWLPGFRLPRRYSCMVDLMSPDPSTTLADFSKLQV
jgi:hypothetical protein